MKIADLKQPYRRMAEYLAEKNTCTRFKNKEILNDSFDWYQTNVIFWVDIADGDYPPITEEIKQHFPPDFDFSEEEEAKSNDEMLVCTYCGINPLKETCKHPKKCSTKTKVKIFVESNNDNMSLFNRLNQRKIEDENLQKRIYTQLAKEGRFNELPDTCEFSEPVELEVWDNELMDPVDTYVLGKFKSRYVTEANLCWKYAKLPTPKIDFSKFKSGDVVEVELSNEEKRIGWFDYADRNQVVIKTLQRKGNQVCNGGSCSGSKMFNLEKIKLITKIK